MFVIVVRSNHGNPTILVCAGCVPATLTMSRGRRPLSASVDDATFDVEAFVGSALEGGFAVKQEAGADGEGTGAGAAENSQPAARESDYDMAGVLSGSDGEHDESQYPPSTGCTTTLAPPSQVQCVACAMTDADSYLADPMSASKTTFARAMTCATVACDNCFALGRLGGSRSVENIASGNKRDYLTRLSLYLATKALADSDSSRMRMSAMDRQTKTFEQYERVKVDIFKRNGISPSSGASSTACSSMSASASAASIVRALSFSNYLARFGNPLKKATTASSRQRSTTHWRSWC